jgi:hypothetical protein
MTEHEEVVERVRGLLAAHPEAAAALAAKAGPDGETLSFRVNVYAELRGPNGELKDRREFHNLIVTAGKRLILASGGTSKYPKEFAYIAVGTGAVAAALGDTALGAELTRVLATVTNPDADTLRFVSSFGAGVATGAITESGLLDAAAAGNLLARQVFAAINKGATDTLSMTWELT